MILLRRLGIELAKTMSLNYSNQETSVTVGESVRDEDGTSPSQKYQGILGVMANNLSIHPPIHPPRRDQRWAHGTPHHDQRLQNRVRAAHHRCHPKFPLRAPRQERQIARPHLGEISSKYAADGGLHACHHDGSACEPDSGVL
jgi:hypothetical protein